MFSSFCRHPCMNDDQTPFLCNNRANGKKSRSPRRNGTRVCHFGAANMYSTQLSAGNGCFGPAAPGKRTDLPLLNVRTAKIEEIVELIPLSRMRNGLSFEKSDEPVQHGGLLLFKGGKMHFIPVPTGANARDGEHGRLHQLRETVYTLGPCAVSSKESVSKH